MQARPLFLLVFWLPLAVLGLTAASAQAAENPAFWKHQVKGDFNTVLAGLKGSLEAKQFTITGEENLSKGLENNKKVFGEDKWNTIGFQNATAIHFCSLVFNQEVFNMSMDWSVLCPFKVVVYNMKKNPDQITILTVRPTYLLANDPQKKAAEVGKKIEERILSSIKEGVK